MTVLDDMVERSERLRPGTRDSYARAVRLFQEFAGASPAQWTPLAVEAWREQLRASGLAPQTVNINLHGLRFASRRIEAMGLGYDFARAAETLRVAGYELREAMTLDEVLALLGTCATGTPHDLRDRAAIVMALRTGLRASALIQVEWTAMNKRTRVEEKGGQQRRVILDEETREAIGDWGKWLKGRRVQLQGPILRSVSRTITSGYQVGPRMSRKALHQAMARRGELAELDRPIHPHLFRHTFVTWALEAGVPLHRIMNSTGHRSLDSLSRYAGDLRAESDPVAAQLPSVLGPRRTR